VAVLFLCSSCGTAILVLLAAKPFGFQRAGFFHVGVLRVEVQASPGELVLWLSRPFNAFSHRGYFLLSDG
jgi:hypothetical protein